MIVVLSKIKCRNCGKPLIKNPDCGGDYCVTVNGYVLQQYCNGNCERNGIMYPLLDGRDPDFISNREKTNVAISIAMAHNFGFKETKKIARSCDTNNTHDFIVSFAKQIQLPLSEVSRFLG